MNPTDLYWLSRTRLLIGDAAIEKLQQAHVLVVGLGGVGSYAAEAIARAGVGRMTIIDGDVVEASNRNRQLPALTGTEGQLKAEIMRDRIMQVNPQMELHTHTAFMNPEPMKELLLNEKFDFVVDAIDSLSPKLSLLRAAYETQTPTVSSMGAGGKLDPTQIGIAPLYETYNCKLARYVRKRLKQEGMPSENPITAVFSKELPQADSLMLTQGAAYKKSAYGTISYIPASFGLACASVVIRKLIS
ncbi:tRNA threonylcarbamoyladenosine dehydratase [Cytophagales bacterium LB-30]|uniref:tRNA threonylcarbamoyladenosine dehydratase n=1 Tax=Shiella aurantiaca TaxID=3058365 RepID=A0ABT8F5U0_9BACT|nr:tRNA threonylcarbamoyladenosine dehydratase [Shiella aurantiaca]MDN4165838.1 tRNA threonylcarbamoyladenosine dehydratase [Shiella aurantiaca]